MGGLVVTPQSDTSDVQGIVNTTEQTVIDRFTQAEQYADGALQTAQEMIAELGDAAESFDYVVPLLGWFFPKPISYQFNPGDPPIAPDVELPMPLFPTEPTLKVIALLTNIQSVLQYDLNNGVTGINPLVEADIWYRGYERDKIALEESKEKLAAEWSKRCFDLPDGVLVSQLTQVETEYRNQRTDRSRDIAVKQAELAFQHSQFIIQQTIALETMVIQSVTESNKNLVAEFNANIEGYKQQVAAAIGKLNAIVNVYEAGATVYRAKADAQAAIASVDVRAAEAQLNVAIQQMQLYVKQAEVGMKNAEIGATLRVEAQKAAGQIAATLASGIFAGVSVQAHISAQGTASEAYYGSESLSESYPHADSPAAS